MPNAGCLPQKETHLWRTFFNNLKRIGNINTDKDCYPDAQCFPAWLDSSSLSRTPFCQLFTPWELQGSAFFPSLGHGHVTAALHTTCLVQNLGFILLSADHVAQLYL
ncbi:hypothetical protein BaRGS_00012321 [Batillaria attramentaria]|uniref:Uncharacterized protein n=1 Tax=Batillaria attramentaria TaxID=370345 RepID=A0ABD0LAE6_9CAEN